MGSKVAGTAIKTIGCAVAGAALGAAGGAAGGVVAQKFTEVSSLKHCLHQRDDS